MANLAIRDASGDVKYAKETGAGTDGDPHIGVVSIDQATANANEVVVKSGTTAVTVAASAIASGAAVDGSDLTQGVTTGAAVITDAAGTLQQYLRGLVKLAITAGGFLVRGTVASGGIASGAVASGAVASGAIASGAVAAGSVVAGALVDGADLTQGVTTGAAVVTDATGTIQQYLRGLVKLATTAGSFLVRGTVASGGVASGAIASGAVASGAVAAGAIAAGAAVDGSDLTQGVTTGAAVITDATGTIQQYLRGLVKLAITAGGFLVRGSVASGGIAAGSVAAGALVDGADLTQGVTTGAAVITDATGTIQQYLRGLVKLATTAGSFLVRGTVASGGVASGAVASGAVASGAIAAGAVAAGALVDGADLTQGVTTGAAVVTDATGTVQQYLRGLVKLIAAKINISTVDTVTAVTTVTTVSTVTNDVPVKPFSALLEGGLTELIGEDEEVAQNQYSGSVGVALAATCSGTIEQVTLICGENGDGAILKPSGTLYILDADPAVAVGDAAITAAEWATVIAKLPIAAADWGTGDAAGAVAHPVIGLPVAFHSLANLYFVWFHTLATSFNDNAAHNESLDMNFWIRRES